MNQKHTWYKNYTVEVPTAGFSKPMLEFDIPKDVKKVTGIRIEADEIAVAYNRAFVGIQLSNEEVVPPMTSAQMFMFSDDSPTKFYDIGNFQNDAAKMRLTFNDEGVYTFNPYKMRVVLRCEKED